LFLRADIIVKSVIVILIASSVYSWAIIIEKYRLFKKINQSSEEFENKFWKSRSAESFYNNLPDKIDDPMANVFKDTMQVIIKSKSKSNISNRLESMLEVSIEKQMNAIEKSYTFLATVGSTAPFIGLFGTVWGIMNSFQSIAISRNTSLAIVAPGIAEALFATALGLLAAIPAVVAYNKFNSDSKKYSQKLYSFSKRFTAII
jgi:TolQ protein